MSTLHLCFSFKVDAAGGVGKVQPAWCRWHHHPKICVWRGWTGEKGLRLVPGRQDCSSCKNCWPQAGLRYLLRTDEQGGWCWVMFLWGKFAESQCKQHSVLCWCHYARLQLYFFFPLTSDPKSSHCPTAKHLILHHCHMVLLHLSCWLLAKASHQWSVIPRQKIGCILPSLSTKPEPGLQWDVLTLCWAHVPQPCWHSGFAAGRKDIGSQTHLGNAALQQKPFQKSDLDFQKVLLSIQNMHGWTEADPTLPFHHSRQTEAKLVVIACKVMFHISSEIPDASHGCNSHICFIFFSKPPSVYLVLLADIHFWHADPCMKGTASCCQLPCTWTNLLKLLVYTDSQVPIFITLFHLWKSFHKESIGKPTS